MPSRTTTSSDGHGGTHTSTVTKDSSGRVTSIETRHTDAQGREISNDVETREYWDNGNLKDVRRQRRGGGRRRDEHTTYDERGQPTSVTVRETSGGKTTSYSQTCYRDGEPSTGYREEYDPPGTLRRRIREVYGRDGVIRQRTRIEYDDNGRERDRKEETFDANGRLLAYADTHSVLNPGGQPVALVESVYGPDSVLSSRTYSALRRGGKGWTTSTAGFADGMLLTLEEAGKKGGKTARR